MKVFAEEQLAFRITVSQEKGRSYGSGLRPRLSSVGRGYFHCAPRNGNDLQIGEEDSRNGWGSWSSSPQHREVEDQGTCYWLGSGLGEGSLFRAGGWAVELAA
jgi:hypothetical protein